MIAQALKAKTMELRKAKSPLATFLIAVGSRANDFAKVEDPTGATPVTDEQALRAINGFLKSANDNIELLKENQQSPTYIRACEERELLMSFLPKQATEAEVRAFIEQWMFETAPEGDKKKLMGPIIKELNTHFGAALNKKEASGIVAKFLNS